MINIVLTKYQTSDHSKICSGIFQKPRLSFNDDCRGHLNRGINIRLD